MSISDCAAQRLRKVQVPFVPDPFSVPLFFPLFFLSFFLFFAALTKCVKGFIEKLFGLLVNALETFRGKYRDPGPVREPEREIVVSGHISCRNFLRQNSFSRNVSRYRAR